MTSYSTGINPPGSWQWPDDSTGKLPSPPSPTAASSQPSGRHMHEEQTPHARAEKPQRQRHWKPRTCRICLETVLPTFHPTSENLPGMFQGAPFVTYDSEEGRLIRPCRCKGSGRYVHESCLQAWRHADPAYGRRNFWQCPTCGFRYRLERMQWGRWISSKSAQVALTVLILFVTVFALGFVADPIINLYIDPLNNLPPAPSLSSKRPPAHLIVEDDEDDWLTHFIKGFASLGVLGFVKVFFTVSPWHWFNLRGSGVFGSGGARAGNTGRDRAASISWIVLVVGVCTFLYTVWKGVRAWSRRVLEKAGERVMDVQGEDDDIDDDDS